MTSIRQATHNLSYAFAASLPRLESVTRGLRNVGALPIIKGRDVPEVTDDQIALLIIGLGVTDPDRVTALADLRAYHHRPADMPYKVTLAQTLSTIIAGASANPPGVVEASLNVSTSGPYFAWLENDGKRFVCFGEPKTQPLNIQHMAAIHLGPLTAFANMNRSTLHPYTAQE